MKIDPTGMLDTDHEYSVDKVGNVKKEKHIEGSTEDHLHTKENWDAGKTDQGITVKDQSILADLESNRTDYSGNYSISGNKDAMFKVFYFVANNTTVEWSLDGYRTSGGNEYVISTSHNHKLVENSTSIPGYSEFNMIFDMHSHPGYESDGTKGASPCTSFGGDMCNISNRYRRFQKAGMKYTNRWFKNGTEWSVFPKHYVYHKKSKTMYHYTPWKSSIFIRKTTKSSDLHRNLGI